MYEDIKNLIKQRKNDIDDQLLMYLTNYFYVAVKKNVLPKNKSFESLIDNALRYASKLEFYDETHDTYLRLGGDAKGLRDESKRTIYVRNNLNPVIKEMIVYHEIHHACQTDPSTDLVGITQEPNVGRLIMEAQTQYFAETVYSEIHGINFEEIQIISEDLRMLSGGSVVSSMHNYELYDSLLTKLSIMMEVPKEYFVSINYLYEGGEGFENLKSKYNKVKEKYIIPFEFENILFMLDYIYCVDFYSYINNKDKQNIIFGKDTDYYEIHPHIGRMLSLKTQKEFIEKIDINCFLALFDNNGNAADFQKYIMDNEKREVAAQLLGARNSEQQK